MNRCSLLVGVSLLAALLAMGCGDRALDLGADTPPTEPVPEVEYATPEVACATAAERPAPPMSEEDVRRALIGRWIICKGKGTIPSIDDMVGLEFLSDGRVFPLLQVEGQLVANGFGYPRTTVTVENLDEPPGGRWRFVLHITSPKNQAWLGESATAYFVEQPRRLVFHDFGVNDVILAPVR